MKQPGRATADSGLHIAMIMIVADVFAMLSFANEVRAGQLGWDSILYGVVILCSSVQLATARRYLARIAPASVRGWMRPVTYLLTGAGALCILLGARAIAERVSAS